jgi:hypothetical protein
VVVVVQVVAVVVVDVVVMVVLKSERVETELAAVVVVSSRQPHQPGVLHVEVRVVLVEVEELIDVVVSE